MILQSEGLLLMVVVLPRLDQVLPHLLVEAALLLIHVLWNLHHLVVGLPEEAGFPLVVEEAGPLTVKALLAEVDSEIAVVVVPALETETAVAVHQAFVGAAPVLDFEIVAAVVSVVALPVSVYFLPEFWQRLLP